MEGHMKFNPDRHRYHLLLTGTINPSVYQNIGSLMTDPALRLEEYEKSILSYIEDSPFTDIVFVENSGWEFQTERFIEAAEKRGKRFEFLSCPIYDYHEAGNVKSYGEVLLINYSMDYSEILGRLSENEPIYKVTGRIFLKNSREITMTSQKHANEFIVIRNNRWCYSHVFKTNRSDWIFFREAYKSISKTGLNIEHTMYGILEKCEDKIDIGCFRFWPQCTGKSSSTGASYSSRNWKGIIYHNVLSQIGAYCYGSITGGIPKL